MTELLIVQIFAVTASIGFIGLAIFQLLLALGKPYGKAAWGGKHEILPVPLRFASLGAILIFIILTLSILEKAHIIFVINNENFVTYAIWIFSFFFSVNTLGNFLSKSKIEKVIMTPVSLLLSISCFIVAILS